MVLSAWIALNAFDALLTWIGVGRGAVESSPHLGALAAVLGMEAMLLLKLTAAATVGGILWKRKALRIFHGVNVLMALVVINNALVIAFLL
jgi:hypothetical protein